MSQTILRESILFTEFFEVNDSVAYITTSFVKYHLEKMLREEFNGFLVTNISRLADAKIRGRHPKSILSKANPFLSLTYTQDTEITELALSTSQLSTDINYIDPIYLSDTLISNSDKINLDKNFEIRLQWSNAEMNCDIAIIQNTEALQISTKRAWDTLFEKDKEYSMFAEIKFPINNTILDIWCTKFELDKTKLDDVMKHIQERCPYKLTLEMRESQQKESIFIRIPMELAIRFAQSETRNDGEYNYTIENYLVLRQCNIRYNAPVLYWINPKERYPYLPIKSPRVVIDRPGELLVDKTNDTYTINGITYTCQIHTGILFEKDHKIASLKEILEEWNSFLNWCIGKDIKLREAIFILIRNPKDSTSSDKYESTDKVSISYTKDFLVKLNDMMFYNKSFDIKVYFNMILHAKFLEWREKFIFTDYDSIIDTVDRGDVKVSDELMDIING